jgi:hypothetical protein
MAESAEQGDHKRMSDPIPDKSQASIDFMHKVHMGTLGRESSFNVTTDTSGVQIEH